jgi:hypothetical protein
MSTSEKIAIAAHLHVLLRRKTGRVTDTEWMAANPAYAHEVARLAREKSAEGGHDELGIWADKLEEVMASSGPAAPGSLVRRASDAARELGARAVSAKAADFPDSTGPSAFGDSQAGEDGTQRQNAPRYVKGLR